MRRLYSLVLTLNVLLASLVIVIIWSVTDQITNYYGIVALGSVLKTLSILVISNNFINTANNALMGLFAYRFRVISLAFRSLVYLIFTLAIFWSSLDLLGIILGYMIISLLFALGIIIITSKIIWQSTACIDEPSPCSFGPLFKIILNYSAPLSGGFLLHTIYTRMGTIILGFLFGPEIACLFRSGDDDL